MKGLQLRLCVKADGDIGAATREAIKDIQRFNARTATGLLDTGTKAVITSLNLCVPATYQSGFEQLAFKDPSEIPTVKKALKKFVDDNATNFDASLKEAVGKPDFITGSSLSDDNRKVIIAMKNFRGLLPADGRWTPAMRDMLDKFF